MGCLFEATSHLMRLRAKGKQALGSIVLECWRGHGGSRIVLRSKTTATAMLERVRDKEQSK